jgi:DNA-binding MarR family transcriptional regulator
LTFLFSWYTIYGMNRKRDSWELFDRFLRLVNKYNALGKIPLTFETEYEFHHSERHMLDIIGDDPSLNITEFAGAAGITKGAVSQAVSKLEKKGAIQRFKSEANEKEVRLRLTPLGEKIYAHHQKVNEASVKELRRELDRFNDDQIECVLHIFKWIECHLDEAEKEVRKHL